MEMKHFQPKGLEDFYCRKFNRDFTVCDETDVVASMLSFLLLLTGQVEVSLTKFYWVTVRF